MFKPNVTVACIIEYQDRYLLVEEDKPWGRVFNQPAGHLEANESLLGAVRREVFEETGLSIEPQRFVGSYMFTSEHNQVTYLRFCFYYQFQQQPPVSIPQDDDILATHWLSYDDIKNHRQLRSPLVTRVIDDFRRGHHAPIELVPEL
jgi:phosphatase NudJ